MSCESNERTSKSATRKHNDSPEETPKRSEIKQSIMITGLLGNGLRSIGNSLLGEKQFEEGRYDKECYSIDTKEVNGTRVINFPLSDENLNKQKQQIFQSEIEKVLKKCEDTGGIDAIVFVLKYGVRFTKQEKEAVEKTKAILGGNVFKENVIVAFSYGDNFKRDHQDAIHINSAFEHWCKKQEKEMQNLFQEVSSRCVLFNNICRDDKEKDSQVKHFFRLVGVRGITENDYTAKQIPKKKKTDSTREVQESETNIRTQTIQKHTDGTKEEMPSPCNTNKTFEQASNNLDLTLVKKYTLTDLEKAKPKKSRWSLWNT